MARALSVFVVFSMLVWGAARAEIATVRIMGDGVDSRVVVESSEALAFDTLHLGNGVNKIVVSLPDGVWREPQFSRVGPSGISALDWRNQALNLTLDRPMMVSRTLTLPPSGASNAHRLIVDLTAVSQVRFDRAARRDAPKYAKLSEAPKVASSKITGRKVVVIDPGHGGRHPGAIALSGVVEKEINLKAALALRAMFAGDPRFEIKLTRDRDQFLELEDRVTLARDWGADLFISLHADAAGARSVKGASVYTLAARSAGRAEEMAAEQDWNAPIETASSAEVVEILETLLERETRSNSARFAEVLIPELSEAGPVLRNTHRDAG
ncbi:MAG: N-acetylmuramoyl-L-alanine amidase, partial [Pseudomonadota bacterium]